MQKVNLAEKLESCTDHWHPRIVGELNGQHVKVVKLLGEFVWHHHADEDELFLVLEGTLLMRLRDRAVTIEKGEFFIVPRASSTSRWRSTRCRCSPSSPRPPSTPGTCGTSARWQTWSDSDALARRRGFARGDT